MQLKIFPFIVVGIILLNIPLTECKFGFEPISMSIITTATQTCVKNNGLQFTVLPASTNSGDYNKNINQNLKNSKQAGLSADIEIYLCRSKNVTQQIDSIMKTVQSELYDRVWLRVWSNGYPGCGWTGDNCAYIKQAVQRIKANGKQPGIYTSRFYWYYILKAYDACPEISKDAELWYYNTLSEDWMMNNFAEFGGWKKPSMKMFSFNVANCGLPLNKLYKPQ